MTQGLQKGCLTESIHLPGTLFTCELLVCFLCPTLFTSSGVFVFLVIYYQFLFFFQLVLFQVLATSGGWDDRLFFLLFLSFFSSCLAICLHFCFLFSCFLSFLYFIECVCHACRIYRQYDDMTLHCRLLCLLHAWYVATQYL